MGACVGVFIALSTDEEPRSFTEFTNSSVHRRFRAIPGAAAR